MDHSKKAAKVSIALQNSDRFRSFAAKVSQPDSASHQLPFHLCGHISGKRGLFLNRSSFTSHGKLRSRLFSGTTHRRGDLYSPFSKTYCPLERFWTKRMACETKVNMWHWWMGSRIGPFESSAVEGGRCQSRGILLARCVPATGPDLLPNLPIGA